MEKKEENIEFLQITPTTIQVQFPGITGGNLVSWNKKFTNVAFVPFFASSMAPNVAAPVTIFFAVVTFIAAFTTAAAVEGSVPADADAIAVIAATLSDVVLAVFAVIGAADAAAAVFAAVACAVSSFLD